MRDIRVRKKEEREAAISLEYSFVIVPQSEGMGPPACVYRVDIC